MYSCSLFKNDHGDHALWRSLPLERFSTQPVSLRSDWALVIPLTNLLLLRSVVHDQKRLCVPFPVDVLCYHHVFKK
jgi:hypothetical protein